ncbi:MAG: GNAT family N-acetyltransferase [Gemmatimonadaceae bacterium]
MLDGPYPARLEDIEELNQVFSEAFTERYRRDGMVGVRVPFLNPAVWRYAIRDAADGAMVWRGERGDIAAFNIVHRSGVEGWMGPLAVRSEHQGVGAGKEIVRRGIEWLKVHGATVIGLETMPRTMDNIGFYSAMGFIPGKLTLTTTIDASYAEKPAPLFGRLSSRDKDDMLARCRNLLDGLQPGYDHSREIHLTDELSLGDTLLLFRKDNLVACALCHTAPLVEGRTREDLRVLKLAVADLSALDDLIRALADLARRSGTRRVSIRVQGEYQPVYQRMIGLRGRVRWSDLRMTLGGFAERRVENGMVLSNWEI